ncbi:MAG: PaaI family thioesterase [Actinobacteria bacterium]|nr:MAG: PaaI family thioesterase [Actinomycetota bacterium]
MGIGPNKEGVAWVEIDPEKHYGNRWAHGGMVGALADIASGIAIGRMLENPMNAIDGTIELKVNFLRKVVEGDLTATARVLHFGKRVAVTEVDLTNKDRLCAKAIATGFVHVDLGHVRELERLSP